VPIAGEPLIRRIVKWLARHDVRDLVLNLHYKPGTITRVLGDGSDIGARIRYSWEQPLLGSAGGPRHALPMLDDEFFIVNGDTLTDVDLVALARDHRAHGALVTMAVIENPKPAQYGGVLLDEGGSITGFTLPRPGFRSCHFIGVQLAQAETFADAPDGTRMETVTELYPALLRSRPARLRAFHTAAAFFDVGTPADYLATSHAVARTEGLADLPPGRNTMIDSTSRVAGTAIWDDVVIEPRCEIEDCVLGDNVTVRSGARYRHLAIVRATGLTARPGERVDGDLLIAPISDL
jgi:NDP-sugar pyrophosphorylase family protein